MAKIISLAEAQEKPKERSLNEFIRFAFEQAKKLPEAEERENFNIQGFRRFLTAKIMEGLLEEQKISIPSFLCGEYAAGLLADFLKAAETGQSRFDCLENFEQTGNPFFYQEAGDSLFRVCAVFPERADRVRRQLTLADFEQMGASCYMMFYDLTGKEIGYYMGHWFDQIARIANRYAVRNFAKRK